MKSSDDHLNLDSWNSTQRQINRYLVYLLYKIEWKYGDCRAPFKYPPVFEEIIKDSNILEYRCIIQLDLGGDESLIFKSTSPSDLPELIAEELNRRFSV